MSNQIVAAIEQAEEKFCAVAPGYMKFKAEARFAYNILEGNSQMMRAATESPASLRNALIQVASIGLSLNPAEKLAYLIPRNIKVSDGKWETRICLEPSYMGLIRLATDSGAIKWIQANSVYSTDTFVDNGAGEKPTHTYSPFAKPDDRGEFMGVYAVAKTVDGDYLTCVMTADEIYSIRDRSETYKKYKSGTWVSDFSEMAKKAAIRRLFKTLPRSDERRMRMLAEAVEISNQNEGFEPILTTLSFGQYTAQQKQYFDQTIEQGNSWAMLVFRSTIDESTFNNLYHSFEKGHKGKCQRAVDALINQGAELMARYVADIEGAAQAGDTMAVYEIIEDMPESEIDLIRERLSMDAIAMIKEAKEAA